MELKLVIKDTKEEAQDALVKELDKMQKAGEVVSANFSTLSVIHSKGKTVFRAKNDVEENYLRAREFSEVIGKTKLDKKCKDALDGIVVNSLEEKQKAEKKV